MYIVEDRRPENRLAEFRVVSPRLRVKPLRFLNLDEFQFNKHSLTPRLNQLLDHLARHVTASWNTDQRIEVIRLVGHTDSTGEEKYNAQLGNKRAEAIKAALQSRLKSFMNRVLIVVDPSPGETEPTADNRTTEGRRRNRRVEVFVTFGSPSPPPPPPPPPPCIDPRKCIKEVPQGSVIITKPWPYGTTTPPGPKPKSIEQQLDEKLAHLPRWLSWPIKKAVIEGSCMGLEVALGKVVGGLSESDKDEFRRQCSDRAKKPF
jgi:outer membrane protein OmpA-like peptidoglycan-associated protein